MRLSNRSRLRVAPAGWLALLLAGFWLTLAALLLGGCARADAASWSVASGVSSVRVEPTDHAPGDSARIIAAWGRGCDWRGCPEQYRVTWAANGGELAREIRGTADTVVAPWPAWGDSLLVTVSVRSVRRGRVSGASMGSVWLTRPDANPPAPDSLRVLADSVAALAAWQDSYPAALWEIVPQRPWQWSVATGDSLPLVGDGASVTLEAGYQTDVCGFAVSRFDGARVVLVPRDLASTDVPDYVATCAALGARRAAARGS